MVQGSCSGAPSKPPLFIFVVGHKEVEQFGDDGRHRVANLAESLDIGGKDLRLMGDVKARRDHQGSRTERPFPRPADQREISNSAAGCQFAQPHGAPHDHDAGDLRVQLRMAGEQQRHVSLRSGGHQSHRLLAFPQHAGHQLDGGAILRRKGRLRQARAIQSALAVHVIGDDRDRASTASTRRRQPECPAGSAASTYAARCAGSSPGSGCPRKR